MKKRGYTLEAIKVLLYTGLSVTAKGSDAPVIYHANHDVEGLPWYDTLLIWVGTTEEREYIYNAGRAVTFLSVQSIDKTNPEVSILVLLHLFCARKDRKREQHQKISGEGNKVFDLYDEYSLSTVPGIPLPVMKLAYKSSSTPFLYLVETESISSAVWTQKDFDDPDLYWLIRQRNQNE